MKEFILARAREASTWRALIMLGGAFGLFHFGTEQSDAIVATAMALSGGGGLLPDSFKRLPSRRE